MSLSIYQESEFTIDKLMINKCFQDITKEFRLRINECNSATIKSLYSNFSFLYYFPKKDNINENFISFKNFLLDYLVTFKFIVYKIMNPGSNNNFSINKSIFNNSKDNTINALNKPTIQFINAIFCIEKQCLIIEGVPYSLIEQVIQKLKEIQCSIINLNFNQSKSDLETEINNFYNHFKKIIKTNEFLEHTIRPIAAFMIRRYFYPTKYFKDPSFFIFKNQKSDLSEIHDFLFTEKHIEFQKIKKLKPIHNQNNISEFQNDEFIELRSIYGENSILIFHLKSFHLFILKEVDKKEVNSKEITFCKNFSHRCFVPFYGFIENNDGKIKFVYEFMSNNSLDLFIKNHPNKVNEAFIMMTINRISQGIDYLHKNHLIHRDLKPSNILLDHNYVPYINDYETIKNINESDIFTGDIGSMYYASPEQLSYNKCSYETDIYSFGLIIYYLYHKEHFKNQQNYQSNIKITKSNNIQKLFQQCINFQPSIRPNINEIKNIINDEVNSIHCILQLLNDSELENNQMIFTQFIYENICLIYSTNDDTNVDKYLKHIYCMRSLFLSKKRNEDHSKLFLEIGQLYENIDFLEHDYLKSKEYYKKSSKLNNSDAFNKIGDLYYKGLGFKKDIIKAKKYYEKSAQMSNSDALNNLGNLYYYGIEVGQDYSKSREYYKKSAELNNSNGFLNLGNLYENGEGVEQDYKKAREMYDKSAKLHNSDAYNCIGFLYFYGYGCDVNYEEAEKYFKLANNSDGLNNLGLLYKKKGEYSKAEQYFEKSAKQGNSYAYLNLAYLYKYVPSIKKDIKKINEMFKKSAELNNSFAYLNLAIHYHYCNIRERNYDKAKRYYIIAAKMNNLNAISNLGILFYEGKGFEKNDKIALGFLLQASKLNYSYSYFYLGLIYSTSDEIPNNLEKSIKYFSKCNEIHFNEKIKTVDTIKKYSSFYMRTNQFYYCSNNALGLIYLLDYNDIDNGIKYIKIAAEGTYSFGCNNFGLINQLYFNNNKEVDIYYKRATESNFSLAFFNIARIHENKGEIKESIQNYIQASKNDENTLNCLRYYHYDKRFEISKTFIICLTNLKLFYYYISIPNFEESKKYFIESIMKLQLNNSNSNYSFNFKFSNGTNSFSYLQSFILGFPLFNLSCQKNFDIEEIIKNQNIKNKSNHLIIKNLQEPLDNKQNGFTLNECIENIIQTNDQNNEIVFNDPGELFDFVIENKDLKCMFIKEIKDLIEIMEKILYTPPYQILFGRINIQKVDSNKENDKRMNIDNNFLTGFGI